MTFEIEQEPAPQGTRRGSRWIGLGLLGLGLVAGAGGALLLRPAHTHATEAPPPAKQPMFQCPMHPQILQDHPGDCPICGMKLVPIEELHDRTPPKGPIVFYRSPMNPAITSPVPRKDEMGMDYVPVRQDELEGHDAAVSGRAAVVIDTERQQLIGLRTVPVVEGRVTGAVRTVGTVAADETRIRKVNVKVEGFIDRLFVDFMGMPVAKGSPLFSLYSPEFVSAQREYLLALKTAGELAKGAFKESGETLLAAARERLRLWDVPEAEIERLAASGQVQKSLVLRSPISGVVTAKTVVQGSRVGPGDAPFEITDLSRVWVKADLYEPELGKVRVGDRATFTTQALPGRTFQGRVAFIDPVLDPKTRTAKARLEFANSGGELKPELFGEALIQGRDRKGLLIPLDALLDAGTQKVVFIALGDGRFEPKTVTVGATSGEQVEILSGLEDGAQVVARASFLVDSESRLRAALAQMAAKGAPAQKGKP